VTIFLPTRRPFWKDNRLIFFCLHNLEQRAKKCIELRGEWINTEFGRYSLVLRGRAKDLSAPPS
jgi:hypothetical protein